VMIVADRYVVPVVERESDNLALAAFLADRLATLSVGVGVGGSDSGSNSAGGS